MSFRKVIFWMHLVAGLIAGLSIGVMCFTGTALAFEKEIIAWAERDVRRVTPPSPNAPRLSVDELLQRVRAAQPEARPASIVVSSDPKAAVAFTVGRDGGFYANPYTGDVRPGGSAEKTRAFLQSMNSWHRTLALTGENRSLGKYINGACNIAFCVLAMSGLYLWWPRSWSKRAVKAIAVLNFKFKGKARDFNWHNSIGLWSAPVLIVLTATAFPISYQWGGAFINYVTGTPNPPAGAGPGGGGFGGAPAVEVPTPPEGSKALGYDAMIAAVQKETPRWELITLRLANAGGAGGRGAGGPAGARPEGGAATAAAPRAEAVAGEARAGQRGKRGEGNAARPAGEGEGRRAQRGENSESRAANRDGAMGAMAGGNSGAARAGAQAVSFTIRESGTWPRTASTTLTLDPYTGSVLKREGFSDQTLGRQVRSWTRFLHTGEALGTVGQIVAGLASLGGCFLVYTGFALSWRRFFGKRSAAPTTP